MKILIHRDGPIRVYHHPREVIVHPKSNTVKIFDDNGSILESYKLIKRELNWSDDDELDTSEIVVTLFVN